jgi:disulfide bond formation protein DsbB
MKRSTECYILGLLMMIIGNTMQYPIFRLIVVILAVIMLTIGAYHFGKEHKQ